MIRLVRSQEQLEEKTHLNEVTRKSMMSTDNAPTAENIGTGARLIFAAVQRVRLPANSTMRVVLRKTTPVEPQYFIQIFVAVL